MAKYDITSPDGQTFEVTAPDHAPQSQVLAYAKAQFASMPKSDPRSVPDSSTQAAPETDTRSWSKRMDDRLTGVGEAAGALLSGATSGLLGRAGGTIGGIAGSIATGKYGTQEGAAMAAQSAEEGAHKLTFEPKSPEGRAILEKLGRVVETSKLGGLGPSESMALGNAIPRPSQVVPGIRRAASDVGESKFLARDIPEDALPSTMVGMGSASTDPSAVRMSMAESLPVPIKLTQGQRTRSFADLHFEREAAKSPTVGEPIRQRINEQNEAILKNFDAWIDQTGAEAGSSRATGEVVTNALTQRAYRAKGEIRAAYNAAERSGDMAERIPSDAISKYVEEHAAEAINAPVITSTGMKLKSLVDKDGTISLNNLEEVRKMVGALSGKDATNAHFGGEIKSLIDGMTDGKGGEKYKQARSLRAQYASEFEDRVVIDKLLSMKKGTKDRSVAFEDVFKHSVLDGSADDVKHLQKILQTSGPEGTQAWRELQGATLQHIRDEITSGVTTNTSGERVISVARLNRLVTSLDKDGKLDLMFGKTGAQQLRDINGIAIDAFSAPPGSINTSNTASVLLAALDKFSGKATGIPFIGSAANYAAREAKEAGLRKRVRDALK